MAATPLHGGGTFGECPPPRSHFGISFCEASLAEGSFNLLLEAGARWIFHTHIWRHLQEPGHFLWLRRKVGGVAGCPWSPFLGGVALAVCTESCYTTSTSTSSHYCRHRPGCGQTPDSQHLWPCLGLSEMVHESNVCTVHQRTVYCQSETLTLLPRGKGRRGTQGYHVQHPKRADGCQGPVLLAWLPQEPPLCWALSGAPGIPC